jgi:hypothetical protein
MKLVIWFSLSHWGLFPWVAIPLKGGNPALTSVLQVPTCD